MRACSDPIYLIFMLMTDYRQTLYNEVLKLVSRLKAIEPARLSGSKGLSENGMDIVDIVDIILALEKKYNVIIPDEVPVYTIDDLVNFLQLKMAR